MLSSIRKLSSSPSRGRAKKNFAWAVLCTGLLLIFGLPTFAADSFTQVKVDDSQNGDTIHLSGNSMLFVQLPCFTSGGYLWRADGNIPKILKDVSGTRDGYSGPEFVDLSRQGRSLPGDRMAHILRFTGCDTGWCVLMLAESRPFEKGKAPVKYFRLYIHVDSPFTGSCLEPKMIPAPCYVPPPKSEVEIAGLPGQFNWNDSQWVTPAKDQGQTGCCWAFGSTGVMEAQIMRYSGRARGNWVDCSEQFLVSCNPWQMSSGNGGFFPYPMAINYIAADHGQTAAGVVYESDLPFNTDPSGDPDNVSVTTALPHHEKLKSWGYVDGVPDSAWPNVDHFASTAQIKRAIWRYGPVTTAVDDNMWSSGYSGGVAAYYSNSGSNHIVMITGWNDDSSCFYVKNSWGTSFGENGYIRVAYETSDIGDDASWASWNDSSYTGLDPNAVASGPGSIPVGDTATYSGTASTYPSGSITAYHWRFGDGDTASGATVKHVFKNSGSYFVELTVLDSKGGFSGARVLTNAIDMSPTTAYSGGPWPVPGTIQAEDYDVGGQDRAYYDAEAGNAYGSYRNDDVDIEVCSDVGGGYDITQDLLGEWMKYTVNAQSGEYQFSVRTAHGNGFTAPDNNPRLSLCYDDTIRIGSVLVPESGGWQTYATTTCDTEFPLTAGLHRLTLTIEGQAEWYGAINWLSLQRVGDIQTNIPNLTKKNDCPALVVHGKQILWNLERTGQAEIRLYSLNGCLISNIAQGAYSAGSHSTALPGTLATGMYLLQYKFGNVSRSVKVNIVE